MKTRQLRVSWIPIFEYTWSGSSSKTFSFSPQQRVLQINEVNCCIVKTQQLKTIFWVQHAAPAPEFLQFSSLISFAKHTHTKHEHINQNWFQKKETHLYVSSSIPPEGLVACLSERGEPFCSRLGASLHFASPRRLTSTASLWCVCVSVVFRGVVFCCVVLCCVVLCCVVLCCAVLCCASRLRSASGALLSGDLSKRRC